MTERQTVLDPTVTHTVASLNTGSGWSAMAKIVRDVDEEKIRDQKEDIDTVLVFAGLYSAVLTAFLIESYQNLRQDPQDVMVTLLQQLVAQTQSYSLHAAYLNSTAAPLPSSPPAFQPSVNAVRVNVLWFASLVLSLVSASFGILVKQWLREYLAGEYTSPQARLRIRHFRNPGLATWKVFEIAAALPMLLQLSLALFFVGLCFFSADVHSSIGHTTIPLVAGWAFLFAAASLAPSVSARCPYKTPLLKSVAGALRKHLYQGGLHVRERLRRAMGAGSRASANELYQSLVYDEEDAARNDKDDVGILITVDAIQSDVQLLSVMWEALQQTQLDPTDVVTFLYKIVGHRLQRDISEDSDSNFLDLNSLPKATCMTIMAMAAEVLGQEVNRQVTKMLEWTPWMLKCLDILLAETSAPLPDSASSVLALCLKGGRHKVVLGFLKAKCHDAATFSHVFPKLEAGLKQMRRNTKALMSLVQDLMQQCFCHSHDATVTHPKLMDVIQGHPEIPSEHTQYLAELFVDRMVNEVNGTPGSLWPLSMDEELECLLAISTKLNTAAHHTTVKFVHNMLVTRGTWGYCKWAMGISNPNVELRDVAQGLFLEAIMICSATERQAFFRKFETKVDAMWRKVEADDSPTERRQRLDPLQICCMQLRVFKALRDNNEVPENHQAYLRKFWLTIIDGLRMVAERKLDDHPTLARECMALIDELEPCPVDLNDEKAFSAWANSFGLQESAFTVELIAGIIQFEPDGVHTGAHARRIAGRGSNN